MKILNKIADFIVEHYYFVGSFLLGLLIIECLWIDKVI